MITIQKPDGSRVLIDDADLSTALRKGSLPVVEVRPGFDPATQQLVLESTFAESNRVVDTYRVEAIPVDPQTVWQSKLDAGYLDASTGIKLKTTMQAQQSFTSMTVLASIALNAGAITADSAQTVWDFNDQPVILPTSGFLALMLRYGMFCKGLFDEFAP